MKKFVVAAFFAACSIASAQAQTATATGTGVGVARSTSQAVAVSGQGGSGTGVGNVTINSGAPATQTISTVTSGTQTLKNVPSVFAPGLTSAGLETCLGSISAGAGVVGTGATFGTTIPDAGCAARLDARTLWSFGLKKAAVARLCLMTEIYNAMPEVCVLYLPQRQPGYGYQSAAYAAPVYTGGTILLVDGHTGKDRLCNDYDVAGQRCRVWASTPKKTVILHNASTPAPALKTSENIK